MEKTYFLILDDGLVFRGTGFGAPAHTAATLAECRPDDAALSKGTGEVVFNTAMAGYHEVLTDPSYTGQLVLMTYPHIGNYGAVDDWSEVGPETDEKRITVKVSGFIVRSLFRGQVPDGRITLDEFLRRHGTPGISGIDTRKLTLHLRNGGSQNGVIVRPAEDGASVLTDSERNAALAFLHGFPPMVGRELVHEVGTGGVQAVNSSGSPHIALYDCGTKAGIIREMASLGCKISVVPSGMPADEILALRADAFLISNGPGDPAVLGPQVRTIQGIIGKLPTFGVCLGHQLIALALGAKTFKMKFGHHGVNHPVRDERTRKVFVTSQNHGFSVDEETLPRDTEVWFRNANDRTVEGILNERLPVLSAQFHPESSPGPRDSTWIFRAFLNAI